MNTLSKTDKFKSLIEGKVREFQDICASHEYIEKFIKLMQETCKNKNYTINNSIEYENMLERMRFVVVDLFEWLSSMAFDSEGNFLGKVMAEYLKDEIVIPSNSKLRNKNLSDLDMIHNHYRNAALSKFGECKQKPKKHQTKFCNCHVLFLIDEFTKEIIDATDMDRKKILLFMYLI
jgi:hypothetical protein